MRQKLVMAVLIFAVLGLAGRAYGDPPLLVKQAQLVAADPALLAQLGASVAISGDTVVGGAPAFFGPGAAYVFVKSGRTTWSQQQKLTATTTGTWSGFGSAVAISGDTIVVGSPFERGDGNFALGAVYIFVRSGTSWSLQQKLTPARNDINYTTLFGGAVAINGDTILVGHVGDFNGSSPGGSVHAYVWDGTTWSEQQKLVPTNPANGFFGDAVALDGDTAVIGDGSYHLGSAYIFARSGSFWTLQQRLRAGATTAGVNFGLAVAIDGETLVVTDPADDAADFHSGSAYVYTKIGQSWSLQQKLTAADPDPPGTIYGKRFGHTVALSGDTLLAGADDDNNQRGAAYIFDRIGTSWSQRQKLTNFDDSVSVFGLSVALSGDTAAIGSNWGGPAYGAVYIYAPVPINHPPLADAGPDQTVECTTPLGAPVLLDGSRSSDPDEDPLTFLWSGPFGAIGGASPTVQIPLGTSTVTLTVDDGRGGTASDTAQIAVQDTTAPVVSVLTAEPSRLWPPNHKMVPVTLAVAAADRCDPYPGCVIETVTSNEPIAGDVSITGPLSLELRADRAGSGPGRTYSITVGCRDAAGNRSTATVGVLVPHDNSGH